MSQLCWTLKKAAHGDSDVSRKDCPNQVLNRPREQFASLRSCQTDRGQSDGKEAGSDGFQGLSRYFGRAAFAESDLDASS